MLRNVSFLEELENREIKHDVIRELAFHFVPFLSNSKINPLEKQENNQTLRKTQTCSKQLMAEVEFLPFAGKTNVLLSLSNIGRIN